MPLVPLTYDLELRSAIQCLFYVFTLSYGRCRKSLHDYVCGVVGGSVLLNFSVCILACAFL